MFQPTLKPTAPNRFVEVKSEMTKTKIILVVLALSLVIMAAAGVAYAQSVSAQNQNGTYRQTPVLEHNGYNGCYPSNIGNGYSGYTQSSQQGACPYGIGMGMCGRYW
jgi:peptidoglycan hydrolase-like amidase